MGLMMYKNLIRIGELLLLLKSGRRRVLRLEVYSNGLLRLTRLHCRRLDLRLHRLACRRDTLAHNCASGSRNSRRHLHLRLRRLPHVMSWRGMVVMVVMMPHTGLVLGLLGGRGGM